jgi:lipopolysaccharide biosynthesis protein
VELFETRYAKVPEYHGNPIDESGSLVTFHYGYDLVRIERGPARFSFDVGAVRAASMRRASVIDLARAAERPRVTKRIRLSVAEDLVIRPLLRGRGREGRMLAKTMRALTHWGFGLASDNLQRTPDLLEEIDPVVAVGGQSSPSGKPRFVVALHLFYEELWPEFAFFLTRIEQPFHLIVTSSRIEPAFASNIRRLFPGAEVIAMQNRGRDVGPFLQLLNEGRLDGFEFVLKLHGKRSTQTGLGSVFGHVWRRASLIDLAGSGDAVGEIIKRFDEHPEIGLIGSPRFHLPGQLMSSSEAWGESRERTLALAARLELPKRISTSTISPALCSGFAVKFWSRSDGST